MIQSSVKLRLLALAVVLTVIALFSSRCLEQPARELASNPAAESILPPEPNTAAEGDRAAAVAAIKQTAAEFSRLYLQYRWDDPADQVEQLQPLVTPSLMDQLRTSSSALAGRAELAERREIGQVALSPAEIAIQFAVASQAVTVWTYPQLHISSDQGNQTYSLTLTLQLVQQDDRWLVAEVIL